MPVVWDVILAFARGFDWYVRSCSWQDEAACHGKGPENFFVNSLTGPGRPSAYARALMQENEKRVARARQICRSCSEVEACKIYALMANEFKTANWVQLFRKMRPPIWGGITTVEEVKEAQRQWILSFARAGLKAPVIEHESVRVIATRLNAQHVKTFVVKEVSMEELDSAIGRASMHSLPNILGLLANEQVIGNRAKITTRVARRLLISDPAAKQRIDWLCEHGYLRFGDQGEKEQLLACEKAFDESAPVEQAIGPNSLSSRSTEAQIVPVTNRTEIEELTDGLDAIELSVLETLFQKTFVADELNDASNLLAIELNIEESELRKIVRRLQSRNYLVVIASNETAFGEIRLSALGQKVFPPEENSSVRSQQTVSDEREDKVINTSVTEYAFLPEVSEELRDKRKISSKSLDILAILYGMTSYRIDVDGHAANMQPLADMTLPNARSLLNGLLNRLKQKELIHVELINPRRTKYIELTPLGVATLLYHRPELAIGAEVVKTDDPAECGEDDEAVITHETEDQEDPVVAPDKTKLELREDDVQSAASLGNLLDEERRGSVLLLVEELSARRNRLSGQISDLRIELFATEQQLDVLNLLLANQE